MLVISENVSVAKIFASTGRLAIPVNSRLSPIPSGAAITIWTPSRRAAIASGKVCRNKCHIHFPVQYDKRLAQDTKMPVTIAIFFYRNIKCSFKYVWWTTCKNLFYFFTWSSCKVALPSVTSTPKLGASSLSPNSGLNMERITLMAEARLVFPRVYLVICTAYKANNQKSRQIWHVVVSFPEINFHLHEIS